MEAEDTLKELVQSRFGSLQNFASAMKWPEKRVKRLLNGVQEPDTREIIAISECLDLNADQIMKIFFGL